MIRRLSQVSRRAAVPSATLSVAIFLTACVGLDLGTANRFRQLDLLTDDVAASTIALDLPALLRPVPEKVRLQIDIRTPKDGDRRIDAVLVRSQITEAAGNLPPPANGRAYFLYALSDADQQAVRDLQAWMRTLTAEQGTVGGQVSVAASAALCRVNPLDVSAERFSILIALAGEGKLAPLASNLTPGSQGADLPVCATAGDL